MSPQGALDDVVREDDRSFTEVIAAALQTCAHADRWSLVEADAWGSTWLVMRHRQAAMPTQGWKLHLSATLSSADQVLRRALPILLAAPITFKVVASSAMLRTLNTGRGGLSQVGKFITVYPNDDEQAVHLARCLDQATRGLDGPAIPSDRPLAPSSLVHYRYGSFGQTWMQLATGEMVRALRDPAGELVADRRTAVYSAPGWAIDPFIAAGAATPARPERRFVAGRYLLLTTLHRSSRGVVTLAIDCEQPRRCVLKQTARAASDSGGGDAWDRLRHEASVLARLAPEVRAPALLDLVEDDDLFIVMEDIAGEPLARALAARRQHGRWLTVAQIIDYAQQLAMALGALHRCGLVHRDLKSSNIIVTPEGTLRLIDFELAYDLSAAGLPPGGGTRGYRSPQQLAGQPPTPSDDIYSLGALLFLLATGAEPALAPDPNALLSRPIQVLNPAISAPLRDIIERCLEHDPARRFPSMDALVAALRAVPTVAAAVRSDGAVPGSAAERGRYRMLALGLGRSLCATAQMRGPSVSWLSHQPSAGRVYARDINRGSAGIVLALAELVAAFNESQQRTMLAAAADWLRREPDPHPSPLPGLYVGLAGIGAALLRAGQVLGSDDLIAAAVERGRRVAALPHSSPDLFTGTAGRLRFHLWLWDALNEPDQLRSAIAAGEQLLATAEPRQPGALAWTIPPGYQGLSGQSYLGYAHGAAGIGDALLDLFEATADERFLAAARGALRWLDRLAQPALDGGSGLHWSASEGEPPTHAYWCHGATGIARFLMHAAALDVSPSVASSARRAARAVASSTRWANPTHCHGLAGNIELLLDMSQILDEPQYRSEAEALGRLLGAFVVERDGLLLCSSEQPTTFSPDYMIGYAGVAVCLSRLVDPQSPAPLLSRCGLRRSRRRHDRTGVHRP